MFLDPCWGQEEVLVRRFLQREDREGPQSEAYSVLLESCGITDQKGDVAVSFTAMLK